jgi:ATP-dependent DNA helicase DinG
MTEQLLQIEPVAAPQKNLNAIWSTDIRAHFPFAEVRPAQEMGFKAVEEAYATNKKFIIIEAPTGAGKSGIAMAAASHAKTQPAPVGFESGAYILSPQKSLTAQYMGDFEKMGLTELKGRSNYTCTEHAYEDGTPMDCEIGAMMHQQSDDADENGDPMIGVKNPSQGCHSCPYKAAKERFVKSPLGVTNFAYYLNETAHAGQLLPRKMLVLDEGHNAENQILSLADIVITRFRVEEVGLRFLDIPTIKPGETEKGCLYVRDKFAVAANAFIMKWTADLKELKDNDNKGAAAKLGKKLNGLKRFMTMVNTFLTSVIDAPNDWILYTDTTKGSETQGCLIIKPLTATLFADPILFSKANKVVIMSATIGDFGFFMRNLGIDPSNAVTCRIPCDFPVENRPVFLKSIGNMSSTLVHHAACDGDGCPACYGKGKIASKEVAKPLIAAFLDKILTKYGNKKGIVHTHSYEVNRYMSESLTENRSRVITHNSFKGSRDAAIQSHCEAPEPTVLFSPSMTEGLDLKDDLSRFSVIVKVPFPYLDPYVKARMDRDPDWYASRVALALVQATGRSNRHKEDKAHHYILDTAIIAFLGRYSKLFPKWWMDAVVWPS